MLRNITLSAEMQLIENAREKATRQKTSLNLLFRTWLKRYTGQSDGKKFMKFMDELKDIDSKKHYSREELNER